MRKIAVRAIAAAAVLVSGAATAGVIDFESVPAGTYSSVTDQGVTFTFSGGTGTFELFPECRQFGFVQGDDGRRIQLVCDRLRRLQPRR